MNRKTEFAAARSSRRSINVWGIAGMKVRAPTLYDALFVCSPYNAYRKCVVYIALEEAAAEGGDIETDVDNEFDFYCGMCNRLMDPEHAERLAEEVAPLVGEIEIVKTECSYSYCGALTDVDDMTVTGCCGELICNSCLDCDEICPGCGAELSPVDMLNILADR